MGLAAILAIIVAGAIVLLARWVQCYWTAKHDGNEADLHGAVLIFAPLAGADLTNADLHGANLVYADISFAEFSGANLAGVDLQVTQFYFIGISGARYDRRTRWPAGFDPAAYGAVRVE